MVRCRQSLYHLKVLSNDKCNVVDCMDRNSDSVSEGVTVCNYGVRGKQNRAPEFH